MDAISMEVKQGKNGDYAKYEFGTFVAGRGGEVRVCGVTKPEFGAKGAANSLRRDVGFWASILDTRKRIGYSADRKSVLIEVPEASYTLAGGDPRPVFLQTEVSRAADVRLGVADLARQLVNKMANGIFAVLAETVDEQQAPEAATQGGEPAANPLAF
jgi:hypothetical protein